MWLYLVHHGAAVPPSLDLQRPLSSDGRARVEHLAERVAQRGVRPTVVWHSGKLRARQTAEAFWRACNPLAEYAAARGLQPTDPPDTMADQLTDETPARTRDAATGWQTPKQLGLRPSVG